jgi:hypothetical protein
VRVVSKLMSAVVKYCFTPQVVTMALQHEEYQKAREPRVAPWLRRPVDVVDEIGRDTPRIPYVQPRNNIHWSLEEIAAMNKEKDEIVSSSCGYFTAALVSSASAFASSKVMRANNGSRMHVLHFPYVNAHVNQSCIFIGCYTIAMRCFK